MEPESERQFDDLALRAAIRRVWRAQPTPSDLRQRVEARVARLERPMPIGRAQPATARPAWITWAVAAVIVLGGALLVFHLVLPASDHASAVMPKTLASDLVFRHDECCKAPDHHMPGLPRNDFAKIATDLKWRLGVPVLSGSLNADHLAFEGASLCPVGRIDSAHLLYKGDNREAVSVFTLPALVVPSRAEGEQFQKMADEHAIYGFVHGAGFYCVVESGARASVSIEHAKALLGQLKPELTAEPRTTLASAPR